MRLTFALAASAAAAYLLWRVHCERERTRLLAVIRIQSARRGILSRRRHGVVGKYDPYDGFSPRQRNAVIRIQRFVRVRSSREVIYRGQAEDPVQKAPAAPGALQVQAGGHTNTLKADASGYVLKTTHPREAAAYESVQGTALEKLFPGFGGRKRTDSDKNVIVKLQNLVGGLAAPCVMDIKMGTRTFEEKEVHSTGKDKKYADKMYKLDPTSVTDEERTTGVTKFRYMSFREARSSSAAFGWRIDGLLVNGSGYPDCKELQSAGQLGDALHHFVQGRADLAASFQVRLEHMSAVLAASDWFAAHELVGTSLLFVYDDSASGDALLASATVHMIDFAKTFPLDAGRKLTHRAPWELGNREDGYLRGMDHLIRAWDGTQRKCRAA